MSRSRTLSDMLQEVRTRTNQENSSFVTDTELTGYLNQEITRLWRKLISGSGHPHFRTQSAFTVTTATSLQSLPSDFFSMQEVTATFGGVTGFIRPFTPSQRGAYLNAGYAAVSTPTKYRIQGNNIEFLPVTQTFTGTYFYFPTATKLVNNADTFDGYCGYEAGPIYGVCATVAAKEESDPGFYKAMQAEQYEDITTMIAQRDASNPETVQDIQGTVPSQFGWWFR